MRNPTFKDLVRYRMIYPCRTSFFKAFCLTLWDRVECYAYQYFRQ